MNTLNYSRHNREMLSLSLESSRDCGERKCLARSVDRNRQKDFFYDACTFMCEHTRCFADSHSILPGSNHNPSFRHNSNPSLTMAEAQGDAEVAGDRLRQHAVRERTELVEHGNRIGAVIFPLTRLTTQSCPGPASRAPQ